MSLTGGADSGHPWLVFCSRCGARMFQENSGCEYGRNEFFFKELNDLRATNEELRRQLGKALETQKMDVCSSCETQLLCLKCSGLLSQCIVNTSFSPTNDENSTSLAGHLKTLPVTYNSSPNSLMGTSSLGGVLSPPCRESVSPAMNPLDVSQLSFNGASNSSLNDLCATISSQPECTLSDTSNEVDMITRRSTTGNE